MIQNEEIKKIQELFKKEKYGELAIYCEKLSKDNPNDSDLFNTLGVVYLQLNKPLEAKNNLLKCYAIKDNDKNCLYNLSLSFFNLNELNKTCEYLYQLIQIDEKYKDTLLFLAQTLLTLNKIEDAIKYFIKALKYNDLQIAALDNLVKIYIDQNHINKAKIILQNLVNEQPDNLDIKFHLCRFYSKLAEKEKTELLIEEIIDEKEDYYPIFNIIAKTRTFKKNDPYISLMERLIKNNINHNDKADLLFNLSKAMDDIKEYKRAAIYLQEGNLLHRKRFNYNLDKSLSDLTNYEHIFNKEFIDRNLTGGHKNENIIFILGLPRSGSTLIEQILGSHNEVVPLGERIDFPKILSEEQIKRDLSTVNDIINVNKDFFKEIGKIYCERIKTKLGKNKYIIDKTLMLDKLGFIKLALPNAKIILCKRNSYDHCLSIYQQKFEGLSHPYAYNEKELAIYYNYHLGLQDHYCDIFSDQIHIVNYEDIITSPKDTIENILDFCDLKWDDNCVKFYKNKRFVNTLSSNQVRKPLYSSSINKWKNYKHELKELFSLIDAPLS